MTDRSILRLQPLRIPTGWLVSYNDGLFDLDPDPAAVPEQDRWWVFKEDMLQMRHEATHRMLDVGWCPEGDLVAGRYRLVIHEGDFLGPELHRFTTRDRAALVAEIERLLVAICARKV
ncbi:MAG: hypothetical protein EAZ43_10535 [Betaproteobacteria bacterium]|nr:MAG: hypothetical protein EAZ43_10535 [Betaproteobacteria bacterium]